VVLLGELEERVLETGLLLREPEYRNAGLERDHADACGIDPGHAQLAVARLATNSLSASDIPLRVPLTSSLRRDPDERGD
jgi:hypothetical protein